MRTIVRLPDCRMLPVGLAAALLLAAALVPGGTEASSQEGGSGHPEREAVKVDADTTEQVAPGVTHRRLRFSRGGSPFSVHVLEVDPSHYAINILPVRALDRAIGKETVGSMAGRFGAAAAVNGGYFEVPGIYAGTSHGVYLLNGQVLSHGAGRSALAFCQEADSREHAEIEVVNFHGTVTAQDGSTFEFSRMNRPGRHGEMVVYTPMLGDTTRTSTPGLEVAVDGNGRVLAVNKGLGNSSIPRGGYVVSASGGPGDWLEKHSAVGTRLQVEARLTPASPWKNGCKAEDIVGAGPRLVQGGAVHVAEERFGHAAARHPRTAFAVTRRGTFLFYTVDGRQPASAGMTLKELASELVGLGAIEAINLDGGGSTTMVVNGSVRNSPSDGQERAVSDGILVFSIPDMPALGALIERLAPGQIRPAMLHRLRETLRATVLPRQKLDSLAAMVRDAEEGQITPAAARLLLEACASLSRLRDRTPEGDPFQQGR